MLVLAVCGFVLVSGSTGAWILGPASGTAPSPHAGDLTGSGVVEGSAATVAPAANNASPVWEKVSSSEPTPPGRSGAGFVYDAAAKYDVLFSGRNGLNSPIEDTWALENGVWSELYPARSPPARFGFAMVYDPAIPGVLVFGGYSGTAYLNDSWEFVNGDWINVTGSIAPSPRFGAAMAYDPSVQAAILFGGENGTSEFNDTWSFSGGTWQNITSGVAPSARDSAGFAWDGADGYAVLFGGEDASSSQLSDTWTFSGSAWTNATATAGSPPGRFALNQLAPDGSGASGLVLFGGGNDTTELGDTWTFVGGRWTPDAVAGPRAVELASLAWDPVLGVDVLFGGYGASDYSGNTSRWNGTGWAQIYPQILPQPRGDPSMTYDPALGGDLLFGGASIASNLGFVDSWAFVDGAWRSLNQTVGSPPGQRFGAAMTYDTADGYPLLFGGISGANSAAYEDTWKYVSGGWTEVEPSNSPPGRFYASMAYDPQEGYVVLFGGISYASGHDTLLNDTWIYKGGGWTELSLPQAPSARMGAVLAPDGPGGALLLFGGCVQLNGTSSDQCSVIANDTWQFSGGKWTEISSEAPPPPREFAGMAYDSEQRYDILYGGVGYGAFLSDTWEYSDGHWYELSTTGGPGPLYSFGFTYDNSSQTFVLNGGFNNTPSDPNGTNGLTWEFEAGPAIVPPPAPGPWYDGPVFSALPFFTWAALLVAVLTGVVSGVVKMVFFPSRSSSGGRPPSTGST